MNKIAIIASGLVNQGGVERQIMTLADYFDVDIYCGSYVKETTFKEFENYNIISFSSKRLPHGLNSFYFRFKFNNLKIRDNYDAYITFGSHSLRAAKNYHPNIWYCNAPIRWIYDLYEDELKRRDFLRRQLFRIPASVIRWDDQRCVRGIDKILVNSKNVQNRITRFYGRDSTVLYPPVDTTKFRFIEFGDFYLSTGRLDPIKRVDLIVKAFQKMPDKKLAVVGGGPSYNQIRSMVEGYENIKVMGWASDEKELSELYGKCIATLYVSYKEDFGMIPIESMAAGKSCIGSNEGGMKETIIHEKTGLLIEPSVENIIKAVEWMTPERAEGMRKDCEKRAEEFSEDKFIKGIKKSIEEAIAKS